MFFLKKIKEKIDCFLQKYRDKYTQKLLIQTDDDNKVVEELPADSDNSGIDIKEVVESMNDLKSMAEVAGNNITELIDQDNVRSTLVNLDDEDINEILKENAEELIESARLGRAIEAFDNDLRKIEAAKRNIENLSDEEIARILSGIKDLRIMPDRSKKIVKEKVKLVSKKTLSNIKRFGAAWHLQELTSSLTDNYKIKVINVCLNTIKSFEESSDKNKHIDFSRVKINIVKDILRATDINYEDKKGIVEGFQKKDLISLDESDKIKEDMEIEKLEKEEKGVDIGREE